MAEKYKVGEYVSLREKPGIIEHVHNEDETWVCIKLKGEVGPLVKTREINRNLKKITKEEYEGLMN